MGLSGGISAIGDKQRGMLMKLNQMREAGNAPVSTGKRRPYLASECDHVGDAEQYREQINREITRMIDTIQNPALDEHTLRDTNDEINRKFREKHHWNKRIYELSNGTIDYNKKERSAQVEEGDVQFIVGTNSGKRQGPVYRYFGAAKDLPGVKELLEKQQEKLLSMKFNKKRNPNEIYKRINESYFGWRDEEDGVLLELENDAFDKYRKEFQDQERITKRQKNHDVKDNDATAAAPTVKVVSLNNLLSSNDYFNDVPTKDEIKQSMFQEKKRALLAKFLI